MSIIETTLDGLNRLTSLLRDEIEVTGPLSFARFMELALYHPEYGYYQRSLKQIGCQGDFYTNVSVGSLFGRLLAYQIASWLDGMGQKLTQDRPGSVAAAGAANGFQLLEAGAHDGSLARDILSWMQTHRPDLLDRLEYWIIEPHPSSRQAQSALLEPFRTRMRWFGSWRDIFPSQIRGVILTNELLDALPFGRAGWDAAKRTWFEWRVSWEHDRFIWFRVPMDMSSPIAAALQDQFGDIPDELQAQLPDAFTLEICFEAVNWWANAAAALAEGYLLTIDYGLETHEFLNPHRQAGTLRSYRDHQLGLDPLLHPGEQDLTAHINFSSLLSAGEAAGLRTELFVPQSGFLTGIVRRIWETPQGFDGWTRRDSRQLNSLVHPEYLGQAFRVLLQTRTANAQLVIN